MCRKLKKSEKGRKKARICIIREGVEGTECSVGQGSLDLSMFLQLCEGSQGHCPGPSSTRDPDASYFP